MLELVEAVLAAWRVAYMLVEEEGPGRIFYRIRAASGIKESHSGSIISYNDWTPLFCVCCTAVYAAVLCLVFPSPVRRALAVAGGATLIEKARGALGG